MYIDSGLTIQQWSCGEFILIPAHNEIQLETQGTLWNPRISVLMMVSVVT